MDNLSKLLASAIDKEGIIDNLEEKQQLGVYKTKKGGTNSPSLALASSSTQKEREAKAKAILQLSTWPVVLDLDKYINAHQPNSPRGDLEHTRNVVSLANAIPELSQKYVASDFNVEDEYNIILDANTTDKTTSKILNRAKSRVEGIKKAGLDGSTIDWLPVYTSPDNWCKNLKNGTNLNTIEIDFSKENIESNDFITLGRDSFGWHSSQNDKLKISLDDNTKVLKITLTVCVVKFIRKWFDLTIFKRKDWKLSGFDPGYYSNGKIRDNDGTFPLLPTHMLVGNKIKVKGEFHKNDLKELNNRLKNSDSVALGPFLLKSGKNKPVVKSIGKETTITSNSIQVVGYISQLVPFAPSI